MARAIAVFGDKDFQTVMYWGQYLGFMNKNRSYMKYWQRRGNLYILSTEVCDYYWMNAVGYSYSVISHTVWEEKAKDWTQNGLVIEVCLRHWMSEILLSPCSLYKINHSFLIYDLNQKCT